MWGTLFNPFCRRDRIVWSHYSVPSIEGTEECGGGGGYSPFVGGLDSSIMYFYIYPTLKKITVLNWLRDAIIPQIF